MHEFKILLSNIIKSNEGANGAYPAYVIGYLNTGQFFKIQAGLEEIIDDLSMLKYSLKIFYIYDSKDINVLIAKLEEAIEE